MLELQISVEVPSLVNLTKGRLSVLTRSVASQVRKAVVQATPKDSGAAKRSWTPVRKTTGGYSFNNPLDYAHVLEYGSEPGKRPWPSAGPKTVLSGGKIYSAQAPGGIYENADVDAVANRVAQELFEKLVANESR